MKRIDAIAKTANSLGSQERKVIPVCLFREINFINK
jgi:hypothetical protein